MTATGSGDMLTPEALGHIEAGDAWLDGAVADTYQDQPLGQDWARVAKLAEEAGEAISALIGCTGQNPRKGVIGTEDEMLAELADTATCGMLAIQHFTKDTTRTHAVLGAALAKVAARAARHALAGDPPVTAQDGVVRYSCTRVQMIEALGEHPLGEFLTLEKRAAFADRLLGHLPEASATGFGSLAAEFERKAAETSAEADAHAANGDDDAGCMAAGASSAWRDAARSARLAGVRGGREATFHHAAGLDREQP